MKRLLVLLLILPVLAACVGGLSEKEAEDALRSAFEGDTLSANAHFCPQDQLQTEVTLPVEVVFKEATCSRRGLDEMHCTLAFEDGSGDEMGMTVVFRISDDRLCQPQVQ